MSTKSPATVIYHSADFDGAFSGEIARKFLPADTTFIGWDFGDSLISMPESGDVYIIDLPPDCIISPDTARIIWIDHHASAIAKWAKDIPGYRIDGVAACRLAWQWFLRSPLPEKHSYIERLVSEPLSVRLAGEYDVWDKRDPRAETFQYGLRSMVLDAEAWKSLLSDDTKIVTKALVLGEGSQLYAKNVNAGMMRRAFLAEFEGLKFLCLNTASCNSLTFASRDVPETGHDALMGFYFNGKQWNYSLYHAAHRTDIDLSAIAVKYGGGGHKGACGFQTTINFPGVNCVNSTENKG
jgi:uncharacterized protein